MAMKLPRVTIEELDGLVEKLNKPDAQVRDAAMERLADHERSGRLPLEALLEFCEVENPALSMYAISALGRNGEPPAVKKLIELAERHRNGNVLFLEQIIDALGETRSHQAAPLLAGLLGIRSSWSGKLFGRLRKEEDDAEQQSLREQVALPVLRALENVADPRTAPLLGDFLTHPEPLVRWHTIRLMSRTGTTAFNDKVRELASSDSNELVREAASLALDRLEPLPPNLNN